MSSTTSSNRAPDEVFTARLRHKLNGIEFFLKSAPIEAAMRLISENQVVTPAAEPARPGRAPLPGWAHERYYRLAISQNGLPTALPGFGLGRFDLWGSRELVFSRAPFINLSPLLAVGLSEGVTLTIPTVISDKDIKTYIEQLESAIRQFYIDYLKESEFNIRITTERF